MENVNPYETPEGKLVTDDDGVGEIKFFSTKTRVGRIRYLSHSFILTLLGYLLLAPGFLIMMMGAEIFGMLAMGVGYIGALVLFVIVMVQRLHDLNRSGWFSLLMLIPLINIGLAIYLLFWPGTPGTNDFGLRPPPNKLWNWICGLIFPFLAIIGIVAALAIPAYQEYTQKVQKAQSQFE